MKRIGYSNGFTLLELLVVLGVIGVLIGLLIPAVQAAREAARRMSCSNNMKQVSLAVAQYHSAFNHLPPHGTGTFSHANAANNTNQFRLSFLVSITPFIEQAQLWESISSSLPDPMGPAPHLNSYTPWITEVPTFRCPSDPGYGLPSLGRTNYAACLGDAIEGLDQGMWRHQNGKWSPSGEQQMLATGRGMFVPRMITSFDDVSDGLSNTIMLGEICTGLGDGDIRTIPSLNNGWNPGVLIDLATCDSQQDPERPQFWSSSNSVGNTLPKLPASTEERGYRWADAMPLMTAFNTTLPPNDVICFGGDETTIGTLTASSRHQGGGHIAMGDGSVIFMTDSVECGYSSGGSVILGGKGQNAPGSPSPFGLWGALGTRNQHELIEEQLNQ